ncbi:pyruvate, water dikinase regulatory protein [Roseobacter sp. HKCCA0434]|uniref:pyruvate, water dikinase regulatory protein n=1 Tax=Roseobacter sp. HKCCA0434 TaxID=3079297 RepID=UPI002905C55F|nr:pyruvate, water dikinase regulatory protein [Roseobacter sp. HKCCA0434]
MTDERRLLLHLVSDSTGNTLAAAARATAIRFESTALQTREHVFVRTPEQLDAIMAEVEEPALLLHTLADPVLRAHLDRACNLRGIEAIGLLDSTMRAVSRHLGPPREDLPGQQHRVDRDYLNRIAAIDFAMAHDDGLDPDRLLSADVILVGVSRSSKTPTCIYLGYQGIKAANVPLVPDVAAPPSLIAAMEGGVPVIGLVVSPNRLAQIRAHRLTALTRGRDSTYGDIDAIRAEVAEARLFFERHDIPVIDVSRRSIEETAAAIMAELRKGIA